GLPARLLRRRGDVSAARPFDEEALAEDLSGARRRERGAWFTPAPLVERVLAMVAPLLPSAGPTRVVDPSCGAGAFLAATARQLPGATQLGVELDAVDAAACQARLPSAHILTADALRGGLELALPPPDAASFEL